jgi:hypothetical protein
MRDPGFEEVRKTRNAMGDRARTKRPKAVRDVSFSPDFCWDPEKVWKLDFPIEEMDIKELIWHFNIPFWEKDDANDWDLTPQEVINKIPDSTKHQKKVEEADLSYPIDIMKLGHKDLWRILDGMHRLVKAYQLGYKKVNVRIIPREKIPEILREQE